MAKSRMDVTDFIGKGFEEDDADVLKEGVQVLGRHRGSRQEDSRGPDR